jgi:hypothetical protein
LVITQDHAEPLSPAAEMGTDGDRIHPCAAGDLVHREVGVISEEDRDALPWGQLPKGIEELIVALRVICTCIGDWREAEGRLTFQVPSRHAVRGTPDPAPHIPNGATSSKRLREGLGDRIRCDLGVA